MAAEQSSPGPTPTGPAPGLDSEGVYRTGGRISVGVIVVYLVMIVILWYLLVPREASSYAWVPYFLIGVLVLLLARYLTARYRIDESELRATRLLGGRTIPLDEIRRIEFSSLRELAPTGAISALGPIGWRGRMWSPVVGQFDTVFTDAARGLLISAEGNPLYISPRDPEAFARELSRRVRSYTGPLEKDVGHPGPG